MKKSLIVIPARYGSSRFPGKPLAMIAGQSMVSRVYGVANEAAVNKNNVTVVVATDDMRIAEHCEEQAINYVMTPAECPTGTDRAFAAVQAIQETPDFVINLQGDAPLTPPAFILAMLNAFEADKQADTFTPDIITPDIITPVTQLSWEKLDHLRESKQTTPFSGTTVIIDKNDHAIWFSKQIIPAIRNEKKQRGISKLSPVYQHIGLYGYRYEKLEEFVKLPETEYEKTEGLEQLRALENNMTIKCIKIDSQDHPAMTGVDSPEDIARVESLLVKINDD